MQRRIHGSRDHSDTNALIGSVRVFQVHVAGGRLDASEMLQMVRRCMYGMNHNDIAAFESLVQVHVAREDLSKLLEEMRRCIHVSMDHSDVAASLCCLAQVYMAQGRLDESAKLHKELLAMRWRIHGSRDHSDVVASLCSVAQVSVAQVCWISQRIWRRRR